MVRGEQGTALRHVQMLFEVGTTGSLTDRQLLAQFRSRAGDAAEAAFAGLVERHGPMVIRTCRSVLRDEHAVEDAFQAKLGWPLGTLQSRLARGRERLRAQDWMIHGIFAE